MTRFVIGPDVALRLAGHDAVVANGSQLLAPTLLRSQLLSMLYRAVVAGELTKHEAARRLAYVRALRLRLLGDRVLQQVAWQIAAQLGWPDTVDADHAALTKLQAVGFVTLDSQLAQALEGIVTIAPIEALT